MGRSLPIFCSALLLGTAGCNAPTPLQMHILFHENRVETGTSIPLVAEFVYSDGSRVREAVEWESSDSTVANVDTKGAVKGLNQGTVTVSAAKYRFHESVTIAVLPAAMSIPDGSVRVHYFRTDGSCGEWELHLWGNAISQPTDWKRPVIFGGRDSYGCYADVFVQDPRQPLYFTVHRGDEKDIALDRAFTDLQTNRQFWLKQDRAEIWTSRPSTDPSFTQAEITSPNTIKAILSAPAVVGKESLSLQTHDGRGIPVESVQSEGLVTEIKVAESFDLQKNYLLGFGMDSVWAHLSSGFLDKDFNYSGDDLGAAFVDDNVALKLWSPPATQVSVVVFDKTNSDQVVGKKPLERKDAGVWTAVLSPRDFGLSSLDGYFYQYEVTAYGQTKRALDPYAKSMAAFDPDGADTTGKGAFVNLKRVASEIPVDDFKNSEHMHSPADMIAYEIHVRDFTSSPTSGVAEERRGTFAGFRDRIPHLKNLGITHVQLLPVQNFYTVNEKDRRYNDEFASKPNYNWGYDPQNYFTPEGWFSTNPADPYVRMREFRDLVQDLHQNGIGVIMDVVYNHTFKPEIFESACPGCYYRLDDRGHISGKTGAGPTVESRRPMVRKLIVDSLKYFVNTYHVNGFRFDLMGFLDSDTMSAIRDALGDDIILHGEAWEFTDLPSEQAVTKSNLPVGKNIGAFSDTTRDSISGQMENRGFVQGALYSNHRLRSAIIGNILEYATDYDGDGSADTNVSQDLYDRFARSPAENLGFLDIHDGYTLWDKLNLSLRSSKEQRIGMVKMAADILMTSQGRVILQGGVEMARSKPLAVNDPERGRAQTSGEVISDDDLPGVRFFHENSYRSSDYTNGLRWSRLADPAFAGMTNYFKNVIRLRRALPVLRFGNSSEISSSLRFLGEKRPGFVSRVPMLEGGGYKSFADVPSLTVKFIHGPSGKTLYVAGEVHSPEQTVKNPMYNPYSVVFNSVGEGSITFTREQIEKFDLKAWADPIGLQIKLIENPGYWSSPAGAYSPTGNNTIRPLVISTNNDITVDLAIMDHVPGTALFFEKDVVAYEIDGRKKVLPAVPGLAFPVALSPIEHVVVVHNTGYGDAAVSVPSLTDPTHWKVLLDGASVNELGLASSFVRLESGRVIVPGRSSCVIGEVLAQ